MTNRLAKQKGPGPVWAPASEMTIGLTQEISSRRAMRILDSLTCLVNHITNDWAGCLQRTVGLSAKDSFVQLRLTTQWVDVKQFLETTQFLRQRASHIPQTQEQHTYIDLNSRRCLRIRTFEVYSFSLSLSVSASPKATLVRENRIGTTTATVLFMFAVTRR